MSSLPLVRTLLASEPSAAVLVTSSTATALTRLSMERLGPRVLLQHRPPDSGSGMRAFLRRWRPSALVLIESELWPNLLMQTAEAGVPIALLNGRISDASAARWAAAAPLSLRHLLSLCSVTLCQSPSMCATLGSLGAEGAEYAGDLKQLRAAAPPSAEVLGRLREQLGGRPVWLAASTHEGEEEIVLEAHAALRRSHPDLLLLLAPRHVERGARLAASAEAAGWRVARRSAAEAVTAEHAVYLCDTLGELPALYTASGIAFVGGSLAPLGGHNLLEAAQATGGCAVLHGPHVGAVAAAAEALAAAAPPAARRVTDAAAIAREVHALLSEPRALEASRAASARAAAALEEGVLARVWQALHGPLRLPGAARV